MNDQPNLDPAVWRQLDDCRAILKKLGSVVVACSGGVDSSLLLALAAEALGKDRVIAAHAVGPIFPAHERTAANQLAARLGVEIVEVPVEPLEDPAFVANPPGRCYHCKKAIFLGLGALARQRGLAAVASGANADDTGDYRPGLTAEKELGVRQPLLEAGLGKAAIRAALHAMGLAAWDSPSMACLASRVPYGSPITLDKLRRIAAGEDFLHGLGFRQCRVRDHDPVARLEFPAADIPAALAHRQAIVAALKALGYAYVALDLQGFRSGSMNETLR